MTKFLQLLAIMILAAVMTACAGSKTRDVPPPVRVVQTPVVVSCVYAMPIKPAYAVDALPIGSDVWQQMAALRAERLQRIGYEEELETSLQACFVAPTLDKEKLP